MTSVLGTVILFGMTAAGSAQILFSEDFEDGTDGQLGGATWEQKILPAKFSHTCRNVAFMPDGRLQVGANNVTGGNNRWLTSTNAGQDWTESKLDLPDYTNYQGKRMTYDNAVGFFQESFTYVNRAGELLQWIRLDRHSPMFPQHDDEPTGNDNTDRTIFTKSTDGGVTSKTVPAIRVIWNRMGKCTHG